MKNKIILVSLVLLGALLILSGSVLAQPTKVYVLNVDGTIELGLAKYVQRGLELAAADQAAIILEISTLGGRVDAALEIRDQILRLNTPVIAFVKERAISAGALITIAAPDVAIAPGGSIGAAEPRPLDAKTVSYLRAEFESTAERNGRSRIIAGAMVDADLEIDGLVGKGKILTLTANQAYERGYADVIATTRTAVLDYFNLGSAEIIEVERNWAERLSGFVTEPTISQLLLIIGFIGILFEFAAPGFGIPGVIGISSMALFFGGRVIGGLAGYEVILLFILGLVLIMLEIFVIPGFGVVGALGIASVFGSIFLSFDNPYTALTNILVAILFTILMLALFWNRFRKTSVFGSFILLSAEKKELGYSGALTDYSLVGKQGTALTVLRPSGIAVIDGRRYDVVTEGMFVEAQAKVKVVSVEGNRIVVQKED